MHACLLSSDNEKACMFRGKMDGLPFKPFDTVKGQFTAIGEGNGA